MSTTTATPASLHLSNLAPTFSQSEIRAMNVACTTVGGINLAQGVCDTDPPTPVVQAAMDAILTGQNIYTRLDGITALREGIAQKLASFNKLHVDPHSQVLVTSGATGAFYCTLQALLNPGDELLIFEPFYGYHLLTIRAQGLKANTVPLHAPEYSLDMDRLRAALTPRTRALVLNTPANPSGKVFSLAELEQIAAFAIEHDLFVITDEMYEYFLYDGAQHLSIAALPGMMERTITISGFSKTFSVTGWRLGYLAADPRWIPAIGNFHDLTYICAPAPLQHGAAAGLLQLPPSFYTDLAAEYQAKRDKVCAALTKAGLTPSVPDGAYYILADATSVPGANAKQKARTLLAQIGIATVAGSAFFSTDEQGRNAGDNLLRICYAKKDEELTEACQRLESYRG
ncbi:aminotransferase [Bryocella elongata]|uniref:Aminotransferase n=1 Tax=Bryocella elongata TaxID=863522 RepID=A0A1H5SMQ4_9BACT|nr:pyridoxal phosphate-dependent aminotransferase [Bryocella elongata]SEF51121.1 aminotransferase [Bryocella elongata]